jgi:hypothetical protein
MSREGLPGVGHHSDTLKSGGDPSLVKLSQISTVAAASPKHGPPVDSSNAATPKKSDKIPKHASASVGLSELEWIRLLNPKISTRNGQFPFYWGRAMQEFLTHLFHPIGFPFVYFYIWARKDKQRADTWVHNHNFQLPSMSRPLFTPSNMQSNIMQLFTFLLFNFFIHSFVIIPMILAFLRVYKHPTSMETNITQDYTHEAYFLFIFRAAWCAVVGVKYGFYSKPLAKHLRKCITDASLTSSEQILANWCPDLGRLMFELHVVTAHFPCFRTFHFSISKKHPVVSYLQQCNHVHDLPLCNLQPTVISQILHKLPENNFHKLFWNKTPSVIGANVDAASIEVESYSKYLQGVDFSEFILDCSNASDVNSSSNSNTEPLNSTATLISAISLPQTSGLLFKSTSEADHPSSLPHSRHSQVESNTVISLKGSHFTTTVKVNGASPGKLGAQQSSKYQDVPAFVLMAYAVSRANSVGSNWVRPSWLYSRLYRITLFLAATVYAVPGVMRVSQVPSSVERLSSPSTMTSLFIIIFLASSVDSRIFLQLQICSELDSCRKICGAYRCFDRPEYIGSQWADIFLHVCWFAGIMWWFPIIAGFICCCFIELFRRAKLVEVRAHSKARHADSLNHICRPGLIY